MWLLEYRELIRNLVEANLKVKYNSSVLGFAWVILNPLFMMSVLVLVFSNMMKTGLENSAVYILCGLTTWRFFSVGTTTCMWSVIGKAHIVKKIYFPREVLVLSIALSNLISSLLEYAVFLVIMVVLTQKVPITILLFPLLIIMQFVLVYGISLFLAISTVYFRDMTNIWDVVLQAGFFLVPVIYSPSMIPEKYLGVYLMNPMARLLIMYQQIFLYNQVPGLWDFAAVSITSVAILGAGYYVFKKYEPRIAEVL
jgi:lipopolysaccharide transport system permease protein